MPVFVIDSWPILEWLQDREPASSKLANLLERASTGAALLYISRINYGEILYTLHKNFPEQLARDRISRFGSIPITILSVDDTLIDEAVVIKSSFSLSYGDCFAAALAMRLNAPVVTGDPEFRKLESAGLLAVEWMGA